MELGQEQTLVASFFDEGLKHGFLISKIILLWQKLSEAAILTFKRENWGTFGLKPFDIRLMLLQNSLQTSCLAQCSCHFLWDPMEMRIWISHWDDCLTASTASAACHHQIYLFQMHRVSGGSEACAEDWLKMNMAWHLGWKLQKSQLHSWSAPLIDHYSTKDPHLSPERWPCRHHKLFLHLYHEWQANQFGCR